MFLVSWIRKGTLLFNNIFSIVPAVMMGVSETIKSYEIIIVARFIVGICAGQTLHRQVFDMVQFKAEVPQHSSLASV